MIARWGHFYNPEGVNDSCPYQRKISVKKKTWFLKKLFKTNDGNLFNINIFSIKTHSLYSL